MKKTKLNFQGVSTIVSKFLTNFQKKKKNQLRSRMLESAETRRNKKYQQRKMDEDSMPNFIRLYRLQ